jgi:hypothetical protein
MGTTAHAPMFFILLVSMTSAVSGTANIFLREKMFLKEV